MMLAPGRGEIQWRCSSKVAQYAKSNPEPYIFLYCSSLTCCELYFQYTSKFCFFFISLQLQIQRTGSIRPGKISKIFITHAHGDHSFGLPGLLCIMGQDRDRDGPPLEIYGPEGLRMWLRTSIRYSISRIVPPYRVHELMDIPMAPEWRQSRFNRYLHELDSRSSRSRGRPNYWGTQGLAGEDPTSWISRAPMINLDPSPQFGEIEGGRDIYPIYNHPKCVDGAPIWEVEDEGDVKVYAAPMSHGVSYFDPCNQSFSKQANC